MQRRKFIGAAMLASAVATVKSGSLLAAETKQLAAAGDTNKERAYWATLLYKMSNPVISNLANATLVKNMPVEKSPTYDTRSINVTYLEAVGRTLAGVAPWLALPDDNTPEGAMRKRLRERSLQGIANAVDPKSPDYLNFRTDYQPIVDGAYFAQSFLRAPKALWEPLDNTTKQRVVTELKALRTRKPFNNNWVIFGAIAEAFLLSVGEQHDEQRLNNGVQKIREWYKGDGWYGDGPLMAFDYYNSFVMHPMLVDTLFVMKEKGLAKEEEYATALKRMQRYCIEQERMISPEGTFPPIGRSITYRTGALQALAQIAWMDKLPTGLKPAQVRSALTAVMKNMYSFQGIFDKNDWLQLGFCGHQPEVADYYTSTGSLYMATLGFLPLGLPATHEFWTAPAEAWTAKKAWSGQAFAKDYHVEY